MPEPLISIVEDDESVRIALAALLRSLGYRTSCHASAEAFLASGETGNTRCIITDIHMPGLSGIELKQRLGAIACATPVIMITARPEAELHAKAVACGAFCLLRKPFDAEALIASVGRALAG